MVNLPATSTNREEASSSSYLNPDESVAIVDDSNEILLIFESLLKNEGFTVFTASTGAELYKLLEQENIALILLDIGLPDGDGVELLKDILPKHPNLSIIMLTGTTDLKVALNCLRQGADDYLAKPVAMEEFNLAVRRTLQNRRLNIDNHHYQKQLELTNFRTQFLHQLNLKMNSAYLNSIELDTVLQSILVGITAKEGLKFNRAFLLLFNQDHSELQGKMAIGPPSKADANEVWQRIKEDNMHLTDILDKIKTSSMDDNEELNTIVRNLKFPAKEHDQILIEACRKRLSIHVQNGQYKGKIISEILLNSLQEDDFIITPLFSHNKSLGVIIADNFVTAHCISEDDINSLEIFASQASLAIEHSHLYMDMQNKITELENVTQELEKNKDLLIDAERYSALGHMSAQLVHAIRNPITSIGGIARLLGKKYPDEKVQKFLDMMIMESSKIESTLDDLFSFVGNEKPKKVMQPLSPLINKSIMLFYGSMKKQSIHHQLNITPPAPELFMDQRLIRQMLLHLIRNSIESMPFGGLLTISCTEQDSKIIITIEDSGNGVVDKNLDRIADPFFTTKTYGTGMGLTLVEKIVAEHLGEFTLKHGEAGGMIAEVILPMAQV